MRIRYSALLVLTLLLPGLANAQTGMLRGVVTDASSAEVLPGANLLLVELGTGAATDIDGNYVISDVPAGTYTLRVTFVGYKQFQEPVTINSGENVYNVDLDPDFTGLEEVVVTGIASATSRARAEVSVSQVDATKYLEKQSYQDVSQLLGGKISGVTVQPASGNVGGGIRFVMRSSTGLNGDGQPVIYIDGVRVDNAEVAGFGVGGQGVSMLASINPDDIESIDILKGPAGAALYGTSGSNGVVLIKTKRGKLAGGGIAPFSVNYQGVIGSNQQAEEYTRENASLPDVANSFFRNGLISEHGINISGGSQTVRYYAGYDKRFEEGHINNNELDRQNFRANFEAFPSSKVSVRANTAYTLSDIFRPQNDNNVFGYLGNTLLASVPYVFTDSTAIEALENVQRITRFLGSVEAEYEPVRNLRFRASVGYDGTELRNDDTQPFGERYSGVGTRGERSIFNRRNQQLTYDANIRYSYTLGSSISATTIAGGQAFDRTLRTFFFEKQGLPTDIITNIGSGEDFQQGDEGFTHEREAGLFAQQEVALQNRFFVTLGIRRDFASSVSADAPAIWYPKASAALRVDQFPGILPSQINFLKLRAAYGETGQLPGNFDKSFLRWEAETSGFGQGAVLDFIGNPDIEPERIRELEVGLETELFNNIGIDFTYYRQWAENSIIGFNNAPSTGLTASSVPFNVGGAEGWGFETSLSAVPLRTQNFGLDFSFIWSYQENEVTDLGGAQPIFDAFDINVIKEGLPRSAFYTWSTEPVYDENGVFTGTQLTTTDEDGDGEPDRQFFGLPYPEHNGSFSFNFRFLRDFNLYVLTDWSLGNKVFNNTVLFSRRFGAYMPRNRARVQLGLVEACDAGFCDGDGNILPEFEGEDLAVREPNTDAYREAAEFLASTDVSKDGVDTDGNWIEDASFFKLREVSLGYDFTNLLRRAGVNTYVRSISFTISGRNLWTSSDYSGPDPEVNFRGARDASRAQDFLTLPSPRVIYGTLRIGI